jgi:hypothetical protein
MIDKKETSTRILSTFVPNNCTTRTFFCSSVVIAGGYMTTAIVVIPSIRTVRLLTDEASTTLHMEVVYQINLYRFDSTFIDQTPMVSNRHLNVVDHQINVIDKYRNQRKVTKKRVRKKDDRDSYSPGHTEHPFELASDMFYISSRA